MTETEGRSTHRETVSAKALLCMIEMRRHSSAESARERVMAMMAALDAIILHLPEDPPDEVLVEVERVVTTLRTADESLQSGDSRTGIQSLDLAKGRLERLRKRLMPEDEEGE